ncbi:hypothetical protein [Actinoplanes sp. NPDC026623]|uniref:hypothetical protein n=1 Tax=Actinoplanes sp. NPDC026623 TaxID=3155610 RepID=UPI0033F8EB64
MIALRRLTDHRSAARRIKPIYPGHSMTGSTLRDTEAMLDRSWLSSIRRGEVVLGLLLAAASFAPWWTLRANGDRTSAWNGPHFSWFPVLICLAMVAGRSLPRPTLDSRWAATGTAVALAIAGWGWLSELAQDGASPDGGSHQLAWVLQDQGSDVGSAGGPFDIAWGYPVGLCLMSLLLAALVAAAMLSRTR